jgi:hypothetical protein
MFNYTSMKGSVSKATLIIYFAWERRKGKQWLCVCVCVRRQKIKEEKISTIA